MTTDPNAGVISDLAIAEMLNFPKLYGPGFYDGFFAQPEALVVALEQLETAVVDPAQLTGSETVDLVEAQTIDDLQMLGRISLNSLVDVTSPGLGSDVGREIALGDYYEYPTIASAIETDAEVFTPAALRTPVTVINPPPPPVTGIEQYLVTNITTGVADWEYGAAYSGPVAQLTNDFITTTADNINVTATSPNNFIRTGAGDDAIDVSLLGQVPGGMNVLDGGGGSNFLVGGLQSTDTFFVDDSGPMSSDVWSTVANFHSGDAATVWGVTSSDFNLSWVDGQGATGYTGLTLHVTGAGVPTASLTLSGLTKADLTNGALTVSFGTTAATGGVPDNNYMYIHAN
jgi:hypothetical protein